MALRNMSKALLVFLLLFALASLLVVASPQAPPQTEGSLNPLSPADEKEPRATAAEIPLTLRLKIDPRVLKEFSAPAESPDSLLKRSRHVRYIVDLRSKTDLDRVARVADIKQRHQAVVAALRQTAQDSQAALITYLQVQKESGKVTAFTPYWVFNGLAVTSDLETLLAVAARTEVEIVRADRVHHLPPAAKGQPFPSLTTGALSSPLSSIEWNIAKIGADRVWDAYGLRGQGMVVANMDSGVDWTHPALQRKYRGYDPADPARSQHDYNWFDATHTYPAAPDDGHGHGTHTMGTMVGSLANGQNQVGVAPEARWIAVKVFDDEGDAYDSWIHAGFQWILAPTDLSGQNPDPTLAPDICSNSWGDSDGSDITFWDDIHAWRAAGILPVFAVGNLYQGSLAPNSPGSFPHSFAVGATDRNDVVAAWSCRGPSPPPWNEIKPEVTAPGASIRSTFPDNRYGALDGTSMAAPHVAGVIALLWQAQRQHGAVAALEGPGLSITATEQIITSTAHPLPDALSVPNNAYGWGRVDAYQAVGSIAQAGTFWGRVTDVATGQGVSEVTITMANRRFGGSAQILTDGQGYYTFSVAAGIYDVTATHFYYAPQSMTEVEIIAGSTTQLDFCLTALPTGRVLGRVTEAGTGQVVSATVRNIQRTVQVTTDAGGHYTMTLPLGDYILEAAPVGAGHKIERATVMMDSEGQTVNQDFVLDTIPRILLVDADAWLSVSEIDYYQSALEALFYSYDTWIVDSRSSSGSGNFPPAATLRDYDIVVWSQPLSSPGYIGAWSALSSHLDDGKALLITGQDIGYWDVNREYGAGDYERYLHATYIRDDSAIEDIVGLGGTLLEGITLTLGAADSAGNQVAPSEIAPTDPMAVSVLDYVGDGCAGLAVDDCRDKGFRVVYLAFGLEGAGPEAARIEAVRRALEWLVEPRPDFGVSLVVSSWQITGAPASEAVFDFAVLNTGLRSDTYELTVEGNRWPATVWDATQTHQVTTTAVMTPCSSVSLTLRVEIPDTALTGQTDALTLHVTSTARPAVGQALVVSVTAAMPWRLLPPLPTPRYRLAAAGVGNCQFFVIGGWGADEQASQANEMYDLRTGLWQAMAPKPAAAANIAAATIGGKIYVPGGMRGENRLSVLEIYDPDIDHWTRGTDLPRALTGMAVAAANGKLYVFGGSVAGGECLDNTLEYDPSTQVWSEKAPLPSGPRTYAVAAELNGKIYVAGGWSALRTFECYDPATDSWTLLAAMSTGRQALGLVAVDGYVYAVGGGDGWTGLSAVERYDPETNSWIAMPSLASSLRAGTAAVSAAGRIFVIGGADTIGGIGAAHEALAVGTSLYSSGMSVGRTMAAAGDTLTYAITLRNPGQPPINEATLRDYVPTHTVYVLDSLVGDARYNASANCIEWQGSMPPTCSKAFSFQVTIAEGVTRGTVISNTALVDDGLCGEQAILVTTTVEAVDLSPCQKLVDKPLAGSGDGLSYLIELRNTGGITATNASLIDPLPAYLTYVTGSVVGASYNPALDQIEWSGVLLPSAGGNYRWMDSDGGGVEYDWVDATISGTRVPGGGDDRSLGPFEIGFPFKFYDAEYTQFYLNTNGQVLFGAGSAVYSNVGIPNPRAPNGFIAPFWDDLVSDPGTMYYELLGSAPHRQLVIEWTDVRHFGGGGPLTFEVILYEGSDEILIQYHTLNGSYADGESATVGIENREGTEGIQYQYNGSGLGYPLHAGLVVLFQPVGGHQIAFRAAVADNVPFNTIITNTAVVSDGFQAQRELTATTIVNNVDVSSSFKQVSAPLAVSGDLLTYRLVLACTGQLATVTASLVDYVPPNTAYVLDTVTGGAIYNGSENRIEWMGVLTCIPELPAPTPARRPYPGPVTSDAASRTMPARPLSTADQGHEITFQVHAAPDLPLNTMIGNDALLTINEQLQIPLTATTWVNRVDLSDSSLVVDKAEARAGERLVYSILLTNSGNVTVPNASLMDPIPARASYVDDSVTGGAIYNDLENRIEWSGAVPPQGSVPISFTVATSPGALHNTLVTNTVSFDDGLANVVTKTVVTVLQGHDLSASEKGMPVMALPGDVLTCTIRLRNTGLVSTSASLTDVVPLEASLIPDSLWWSSGAGSADSGTVTWHGEIIAQGMVIVRFEMRIGGDVEPGAVLSNTALIEDHTGNIYERSASTTVYSHIVNLPIIMRSGAH